MSEKAGREGQILHPTYNGNIKDFHSKLLIKKIDGKDAHLTHEKKKVNNDAREPF